MSDGLLLRQKVPQAPTLHYRVLLEREEHKHMSNVLLIKAAYLPEFPLQIPLLIVMISSGIE